jgi:8-oxo-dGTP pyrophosphatase MutT (NUDIX family)
MLLIEALQVYRASDGNERDMVARTLQFLHRHRENAFSPHCVSGHITGSAWILDATRGLALLTHHRKLGRWFQLGGHLEPGENVFEGALREAREESGLLSVQPVDRGMVFDVDVHTIPERGPAAPAHEHYDVRFLFEADATERFRVSSESRALEWVAVGEAHLRNPSESIVRMVRKTLARWP